MSDRVPFHIQEEIIRRLPVKPLIQFRCVSKAWKSLIDSSQFIVAHSFRQTQQRNLVVWFFDPIEVIKFICFVDDETFPQQKCVLTLPQPKTQSKKLPDISVIVGSSHGLLCLNGYCWENSSVTRVAVLWNPSIRKSFVVAVPEKIRPVSRESVLGFGVCLLTRDPKIIDIIQHTNKKIIETNDYWEVKVYKLSSGKWRSLSNNLPSKSVQVTTPKVTQVVIDRFIYWCAFRTMATDGGLHFHNLIMSFDITNEQFEVVDLPDTLSCLPSDQLSISKLRDSFVVLEYRIKAKKHVCHVWLMENGAQKSFTKLFTITPPHWSIRTLGFSNSGQPIIEMKDEVAWMLEPASLAVYDPNTQNVKDLRICRFYGNYYVNSSKEINLTKILLY